jgi:hypothetical protein
MITLNKLKLNSNILESTFQKSQEPISSVPITQTQKNKKNEDIYWQLSYVGVFLLILAVAMALIPIIESDKVSLDANLLDQTLIQYDINDAIIEFNEDIPHIRALKSEKIDMTTDLSHLSLNISISETSQKHCELFIQEEESIKILYDDDIHLTVNGKSVKNSLQLQNNVENFCNQDKNILVLNKKFQTPYITNN